MTSTVGAATTAPIVSLGLLAGGLGGRESIRVHGPNLCDKSQISNDGKQTDKTSLRPTVFVATVQCDNDNGDDDDNDKDNNTIVTVEAHGD